MNKVFPTPRIKFAYACQELRLEKWIETGEYRRLYLEETGVCPPETDELMIEIRNEKLRVEQEWRRAESELFRRNEEEAIKRKKAEIESANAKQKAEKLREQVFSYAELGQAVIGFGYGLRGRETATEHIRAAGDAGRSMFLLAYIAEMIAKLPDSISNAIDKNDKRNHDRAMSLERAKQKTARLEKEAKESGPPKVKITYSTNEQIERHYRRGKVKRSF